MKLKNIVLITLALLTLTVTGCSVGTKYSRPKLDVPATFRGSDAAEEKASIANLQWWDLYQDSTLQELIRTALEQNYDIRLAAARIEENRALARISKVAQLPSISAGASRVQSRLANLPNSNSLKVTDYAATLNASYELDLWGRLASLNEAARADLLSSEYARESVRVSLIGDVATVYFNLLALDRQLEITKRTAANREKFLELTQSRLSQGVTSALDADRAAASFAAAKALVQDIERLTGQAENQLQILLGENPGPILREKNRAMPSPPEVPAGLPSALIERRPDLRFAETNLTATHSRLNATKASLFPTISLTGDMGVESLTLRSLFSGPTGIWSFGLGIIQPLLDANRIGYQVDAAAAREEQAAILYQATVAQAFREVSDALIARTRYAEALKEQDQQVMALKATKRRVLKRYEAGYSSYFEVIDADRDLYTAELLQVQSQRDTLLSLVQLYKALGGGWDSTGAGRKDAAR
jgi:outer membrane protein, multidrug efflux system